MKYLLSATAIIVSVVSPLTASADCASEQTEIMRMVQRMSGSMSGDGASMCHIARQAQELYPQVLAFYERCPIVDPGGEMRQHAREMVAWGRETAIAVCAE